MRLRLTRDNSPRAAAVAVALVLVASIAAWRDDKGAAALAEPFERADGIRQTAAEAKYRTAANQLDVDRLQRPVKEGIVNDLFLTRNLAPPPPPPPPPAAHATVRSDPLPPQKPVVPALPFGWLGRVAVGGKDMVAVSRNNEPLLLAVGDSVENTYRLEEIGDEAVVFIYLPLGQKQRLTIPATK